ncbi:electron transfer flavoprotein subunit beta [Marinobacter halodurans]|uniref:Electron transfer flavoprotein subunit beta n=1 Tax=Marinobacter halodurans TaxID=2528979 RepID=A0ABY1ZK30_9GAMM|nr:electron transfer flavoprotein subunit beta [Marinobacter halodurans]TBW55750.1 electron transfer flavoprotein subunit beta [Marinobacter halodurans]
MWPDSDLKVASLVSNGQHPKSGRSRRASQDARAVELALKMTGRAARVIHVGTGHRDSGLGQYLGMGLPEITLLNADENADAVPVLVDHLKGTDLDIVLTGIHAEQGEASGMVPYLLAEHLGWPLVSHIADIQKVEGGKAEVLQALPRGQRRLLRVPLPFIATVDNAAAEARQYAFGAARRGKLVDEVIDAPVDQARLEWESHPAKPRPKRLHVAKAKSAADRFKAATAKPQGQGGSVLRDGTDLEKATAIMDLLISEGVVR